MATINGTTGNEILNGTTANDTLDGGVGADAYSSHTDHSFLNALTSPPIYTDHTTSCTDQF